jgi:hypothetical protein
MFTEDEGVMYLISVVFGKSCVYASPVKTVLNSLATLDQMNGTDQAIFI